MRVIKFTFLNIDEAFAMRKRLVEEEGVLAGISTGASVYAALRIAKQLGTGKTVVIMIQVNVI